MKFFFFLTKTETCHMSYSNYIYNLNEKQTDFTVITIRMIYLVSMSKSEEQRSGEVSIMLPAYTQFK